MKQTTIPARAPLYAILVVIVALAAACGGPTEPKDDGSPPPDGQGVVAVAVGSSFSVALMEDGTVFTWGNNSSGELGNGGLADSSRPVQVAGLQDVTQIAAGLRHVLALDSAGEVWAWGHNNRGQIGMGWPGPLLETQQYREPVNLGLSDIVAVATRGEASYALDASGALWAWGNNSYFELGDGTNQSRGEPAVIAFPGGAVIEAVFAGLRHAKALDSEGGVWIWGDDALRLGNGSADEVPIPAKVAEFSELDALGFVEQSASGSHVLAIGAGELYGWGDNSDGAIAMPEDTFIVEVPTLVPNAPNPVSSVAAGGDFSVVVSDGDVYTWGTSYFGELGDGTTDGTTRRVPAKLEGLNDVVDVVAAPLRNASVGRHVLALTAEGSVYAWGFNGDGQVGDGSEAVALEPVLVRFE